MFCPTLSSLGQVGGLLQLRLTSCNRSPPPACENKPAKCSKKQEKKPEECCEIRMHCEPDPQCETQKFVSMWKPPANLAKPYPFEIRIPDICCDPSGEALPRFDQMYYHPSCKDRDYQRTWVECPEFFIKKKKICCYEKLEAIDPPRRGPQRQSGECPPTACPIKKTEDCPYLAKLSGCRAGRRPPICRAERRPTCCRKLCAPMPSWSECKQPEPGISYPPPPECFCLATVPMCEVLAYQRYLEQYGSPKFCAVKKRCKKKK